MKIDLERSVEGINRIHSYSAGTIVIEETTYSSSLILSSDTIIDDWQPDDISQLSPDDLDQIIDLEPELVLLGTGTRLLFPGHEITMAFYSKNIGIEVMDTGAACRAFNFLTADGRKVVAALFMIENPAAQPR